MRAIGDDPGHLIDLAYREGCLIQAKEHFEYSKRFPKYQDYFEQDSWAWLLCRESGEAVFEEIRP